MPSDVLEVVLGMLYYNLGNAKLLRDTGHNPVLITSCMQVFSALLPYDTVSGIASGKERIFFMHCTFEV